MGLLTDIRLWAARRRYQPERESLAYPKLISLMGQNRTLGTPKPTPTNLRYFSRTVYARRAINRIKDAISTLPWQIVTENGARASKQQAEVVAKCLDSPNESDSFTTLLEQWIEDALVTGAGTLEQAVSPDSARPIWLWPVDATTIRPVVKWDGNPKSIRFLQALGYTGGSILSEVNAKQLRAEEIIYMRLNPSTETPYGYGPLEIAYDSISWKLGVGRYASNAASNAQPQNLIYPGQVANQDEILTFRAYWRNEIEGQGQTPIIGGPVKPEVIRLHAGTDDALYLKWQEFLIREIATGFQLSPQGMGIERDVNRNTAETAEDRDWNSAIKPMALRVQSHINRDVLWARHGLTNLRFQFDGLDREDEQMIATIFKTEYQNNACTPNEYRAQKGLEPLKSRWADLTYADMQIAMKAAQGAKEVDDPDIKSSTGETE
ncbi:phage portal protein [Trinickia sp.]|uniref:phage portal protein n=1 Tax=Trinickia sp. TaxID=2571163 RepID=UPI003F7F3314